MRLFIIPISTRQALIYARPLGKNLSQERSLVDKVTQKAAETWAKWEEADKGWKKHLVSWGNRVQQRIPYQEWGLKSIPSLSSQRRLDPSHGTTKVDVLFPGNAIRSERLQTMLRAIATDRQDLHRQRMWWSFLAAPLTAPIGLIPLYDALGRTAFLHAANLMIFSINLVYLTSLSFILLTGAGPIGER
ncbi:hypothetical protein BO70DRAFT_363419 [Aspergillus heteromorphus CBS 117.55]|uniref:Uncharacterized protein n=1 Tax=Aspergillus heteromorphus CBS 117.55 TaxID=1448321 RepID=A0A317W009_9EURO|nr:uncharacterized protein BO70DRAFT_363419 [Aspergillus heteromorphus CBS 117.55]PWY77480.1 hypothetical protein BO70DRAFT_363419 [Aspergillus heteromorphus CBS 117.55]